MTSKTVERVGVQVPQVVHRPPDVATLAAAEEAIELAAAYGLALSESQCITLEVGMGERADGSWAARTMGDAEPRQNGKTDAVMARELYGLIVAGEQLQIHTAHLYSTAQEAFLRTVDLFENYDDLRRRAQRPRRANGEQGIYLLNGARLLYKARSGASGKGFAAADLVAYDEAQELQGEHVAAMGGARLANANSQGWYAGSGGYVSSVLWWRMRRRAVRHDEGRFGYVEHTAEDLSLDAEGRVVAPPILDVTDRDLWRQANPAYGAWVTDESLEDYRQQVGDLLFARESLCVWEPCPDDEVGDDGAIGRAEWVRLVDRESHITSYRSFGLDVAPNLRWASYGVAGYRPDGLVHVEDVATKAGTDWLVEAGAVLYGRWHQPIRVQAGSPAEAFVDDLRRRGVEVVVSSAHDVANAVVRILTHVHNATLRHLGGPELVTAARNADVRPVGDVELWARRQARENITPIVAVTVALAGVPAAAMSSYTPRRLR